MHSSGLEMLLDLRGCQSSALNDPAALEKILRDIARTAGLEIVSQVAHQFTHRGMTLVFILSQSHLAVHVWPEEHFIAVDLYVCGNKEAVVRSIETARKELVAQFKPQASSQHLVERGEDDLPILR